MDRNARRTAWRGGAAGALAAAVPVCLAASWQDGGPGAPVVAAGLAVALASLVVLRRTGAVPGTAEAAAPAASVRGSGVATLPDPAILVDARAVVREANAAAEALLPGLRPGAPLSFALRDPDVLDAIGPVAKTGQPASVVVGGRSAADPVHEVRLRRLPGSADGPVPEPGVALFFRDLTDQRRTETMRVDFVANVSHELRTPLASLIGFIETLQGPARADAAARERFLAVMHDQAARMRRLIDDLLQLSRVELTVHVPPSARLDLVDVVGHMVDVMTPLARERGATVVTDMPSGPAEILGDRDELLRVVENLLENAIRYGGGRVEVAVRRLDGEGAGPRIELAVRDHGPGIPSEHLPRLTERFYRVDVSHSRQEGGTGLGLAIVKHIVTHHRGRLLIESEPGRGAMFRVLLPAAPVAAAVGPGEA